MKDHIEVLLQSGRTAEEKSLLLREYLQSRILEFLQRQGVFENWAFLGGTALRFLYQLPRFSEVLDFSLITSAESDENQRNRFIRVIQGVKRLFEAETYTLDIRIRPDHIVKSAFISFPGLLFSYGLSQHKEQKIAVKVEVDTNPPKGAQVQTSLIRRHVLLHLLHYDKGSLFAGKLHAIIHRPYVKGRDVYDLFWYLSDPTWPEPNLRLLRSSLQQTESDIQDHEMQNWRKWAAERIRSMNWEQVIADVSPFLEKQENISLLTKEHVLQLLQE